MATPRERFPGRPITRTTDLDEAQDAVSRVFLPHRLQVLGRTPHLDMQLNALQLGSVTAGYLRYGRELRMVTAEAGHYHVNIPLSGATESRSGSRTAWSRRRNDPPSSCPARPPTSGGGRAARRRLRVPLRADQGCPPRARSASSML
jgi:hypothetical protein